MTEATVMTLAQDALRIALILSAPILVTSLVIGLLVSVFQAATQINEASLTFIPKILGFIVILLLLGSWMLQQMITYTANIFNSLPNLAP